MNGVQPGVDVAELEERFGPSLERFGHSYKNGLHATTLEDNRTVDCLTGTELTVGEKRYRSGDPVASIDLPRLDENLFYLDAGTRIRVLPDRQGRCVRFQFPAHKFGDRLRISGFSLGLPEHLAEIPLGPRTRSRPYGEKGQLVVFGEVTVGLLDRRVCMVHATHLLVGSCCFVRYEPLDFLEALLERKDRRETPSPGSVKHVFQNRAGDKVEVGESRQYPGQCLSFTLRNVPEF